MSWKQKRAQQRADITHRLDLTRRIRQLSDDPTDDELQALVDAITKPKWESVTCEGERP